MATRKQLEQQYIQDRAFWGSVGSRWRALAGGILLGGLVGAGLALASAGVFSLAAGIAFAEMGQGTLLGLVGALSGAGMLVGGNLWGSAGQVSGAVAAGLMAQKELDPEKSAQLQQEITLPPPSPNIENKRPPLFNWKVMALGSVITGSIGAFLAYAGAMPPSAGYLLLGQQGGTAMGAASAGLSLGLFGAVFGVAFTPWQRFKEWTDGFFEGKVTGRNSPAPDQLAAALTAPAVSPEIANPTPQAAESQGFHADKLLLERAKHAQQETPRLTF